MSGAPASSEVAPGIFRIETTLADRILAVYVLAGEDAALLIDTGVRETPADAIVPFLEQAGIEREHVRYALITHADIDHMGGNAAVRELLPRTLLACHELDRGLAEDVGRIVDERYERFAAEHAIEDPAEVQEWFHNVAQAAPIDIGLAGGETFRLSSDWHVQVVHTPGHSDGHVTIYDPRSRAAIVADAVMGDAIYTKAGEPCMAPAYHSVEPYLASLDAVEALRPEILLTAHYPVLEGGEVPAFLRRGREFVPALDAALETELAGAPTGRTARELTLAAGRRLELWPPAVDMTGVYPVMSHLERFVREGRAGVTPGEDGVPTWLWLNGSAPQRGGGEG